MYSPTSSPTLEDSSDSLSFIDQSLDEIIDLKGNDVKNNMSDFSSESSADDEEEEDFYVSNEKHEVDDQYRGRDRSKQKLMWSNKHNQLRHRFQAFERDLKNRFYTTTAQDMKEITSSLASDRQKLVLKRREIKRKLIEKLNRLQQSQIHLKKQIDIITADNYGRSDYEINNLHNTFDKLEGDIDLFKKSSRVEYNEFTIQESSLDKEIFDYNKRFDVWLNADRNRERIWDDIVVASSAKKAKKFKTPMKHKTVKGIRSDDKRPSELINLERKIDNDGKMTGGWTARDHALFLRMISKYQLRTVVQWIVDKSKGEEDNMPLLSRGLEGRLADMLHSLAERLPTFTIEQIRIHWKWYCVHECRIEKKKRLVHEWRMMKSGVNGSSIVHDENSIDSSFTGSVNSSNSINANALTPGSSRYDDNKERERKKKAILDWKREKAAKAQAEEERKEKEALKRKLKLRKEREERMMQKESIAMYKLQKDAEKAQRAAVREVILTARGKGTRRRPPSSETLQRNHERNMKEIELKREKAIVKRQEMEARKERLDRLAKSVAPKAIHVDVTRLTTAALRRRKTADELDRAEQMRKHLSAHGQKYDSRTGAEHSRGKSYTFASFSGRKVANWTRGMRG
eukprot:g5273.t1